MSDVRCQVSGVRYQVSGGFRLQVTGIRRFQVTGIRRFQVTGIRRLQVTGIRRFQVHDFQVSDSSSVRGLNPINSNIISLG